LLRRADGKTPAWPPGITGSLTHSGGWAAAAVARVEDFRGVGVDLERMRPVSNGLAQRILLPPEAAWLADHPRPDQGLMWMFSAKEALYKALHPAGAEGLGFDVAVITFTVEREGKAEGKDFATGSLAWRLVRQAGEGFEPGLRGEGRWSAGKGFVLTGTWLPGLIDNVG
ncbi:MAG: 4'-phosphopantetheinyl transferase superfamily protein, partial [Deltaproteobacteria bacterium]|nr:4'-phosphopantetheinyl transferase superfamily protein [Deltaproteobacteria bacterium]